MVKSPFNGVFQDYQDFRGLEEIAGTVRRVAVSEVLVANFVRHLLNSRRAREKLHIPSLENE